MRARSAGIAAFIFLFPLSQASFSQQVSRVRVQAPVNGSAGAFAAGAYNAAASVLAQPVVGTSFHGLPVLTGVLPALTHPVLEAAPAVQGTVAVPAAPELSQPVLAAPAAEVSPSGAELKLPKGAKRVTLHEARTASDIDRLIPVNPNSIGLIAGMKNAVRAHGPVGIRDYEDALGGHFVAIDLEGEARWLDFIPELQPHEVNLIRKILKVTGDVQVVVREEGKTPDLVVAGEVTEIKSAFKGLPPAHLLDKANTQVHDFAARHMLAGGNLAMDLVREPSVETERVLGAVNDWARQTRRVELGRIMMFAGDDVKSFALGPDGLFSLADAAAPSRPADFEAEVRRGQMLAKKGMLGKAHDVLKRLMPDQAGLAEDPFSPVVQAMRSLEVERASLKIRKLARTQPADAREAWRRFRKNHSEEEARRISPDVEKALGAGRGPLRNGSLP